MQQYWAPGVRRRVGMNRARFDFGSGRLAVAMFAFGAGLFILAILVRAAG